MKGLYVNVARAEEFAKRTNELLGLGTPILRLRAGADDVVLSYHRTSFPDGPVYRSPDGKVVAVCAGWFAYRGHLGALPEFVEAFLSSPAEGRKAVLRDLGVGSYLIAIWVGDEVTFIPDPWGLYPHFQRRDAGRWRVAPNAKVLADGAPEDPFLARVLDNANLMFGNLSPWPGVERFEPGTIRTADSATGYHDYFAPETDGSDVYEALRGAIASTPGRPRILPLSGGLDSRLLLAAGEYDYGYTFGPADTGDRLVARNFRADFKDYFEFSLLELVYKREYLEASDRIFAGWCRKPFKELFAAYRLLADRWGEGGFLYDGYPADGFTRGSWLKRKGFGGQVEKVFPALAVRGFTALDFLRKKYPSLSAEQFELVRNLYEKASPAWPVDEGHRAIMFQNMYGHGSRYALNGSTIISREFFNPVHPFMTDAVYDRLFPIPIAQQLAFTPVRKIWRHVPKKYAVIPAASGLKPLWPTTACRLRFLVSKSLAKKGLWRRGICYDHELPKVRWP